MSNKNKQNRQHDAETATLAPEPQAENELPLSEESSGSEEAAPPQSEPVPSESSNDSETSPKFIEPTPPDSTEPPEPQSEPVPCLSPYRFQIADVALVPAEFRGPNGAPDSTLIAAHLNECWNEEKHPSILGVLVWSEA